AYMVVILGMIAVATPKQIRELMKVDGLTNDEVKSHLQVSNSPLSFTNFCPCTNDGIYYWLLVRNLH
uniref:HTH myb-type domain-containing protein n=1 Tax=Aegilops tauschii subsp. strangulata TaxID=200361 RepID=A0A453BPA5_AEGTS